MDYINPVEESFEERCNAIIPEDRNSNENKKDKTEIEPDYVTSIELSKSQRALKQSIAVAQRAHVPLRLTRSTETSHEMAECSNDGAVVSDYTGMPQYCPNCAKSFAEELRIANAKMKELQKTVEKLEYTCTKYSEANKQWAVYAAQLQSENTKARKSASAEDIRMSPERALKEVDTNKDRGTATRKSEGDLENTSNISPSSDERQIENLRNKVSLLTQQVKIYQDDFSLERRDRVRSVKEAQKLKQEVEKLKTLLSRQRHHHARKEHFITCGDFDHLNN